MERIKKQIVLFLALTAIAAAFWFLGSNLWKQHPFSLVPGVSADDDDEEDEDEREEDEEREERREKTTFIRLPDRVIKKEFTTVVFDSDGDGIFDPDDRWPEIHYIFIVQDENKDGIADDYGK